MARKRRLTKAQRQNRRLAYAGIGIGLLALILILNIFFAPFFSIFFQQFIVIEVPEGKVVDQVEIPDEYIFIWDSRYRSDVNEFLYCLYGEETEEGYRINEIRETQIYQSSENQLTFESCPRSRDYIGTLHSHPDPDEAGFIASCGLSDQDIYTFGSDRAPLTGVICGEGEYGFYAPGEFDIPLEVVVI